MKIETDIVIIGSGVASLQAARLLSKRYSVHIVTKSDIRNGSSYKAQGGIAAVADKQDDTAIHFQDTLDAGEHHHYKDHVKRLVERGKETVQQLIAEDFCIDRTVSGDLSLGLEGAHSKPRIIHSGGDKTGKVLVDYLIDELPENVTIHQYEFAYELLLNTHGECIGVKTKNKFLNKTYLASYVILATGGAGALYACTSNCPDSFGDGIALAFQAGAKISDMEFVQFHPSLLYVNGAPKGLVSEAVRGAGGYFVNEMGAKLMEGIHPLGDLAPRHVTAFTMYKERAKGNEVFIDISKILDFRDKFPTITKLCDDNGIAISEGRIPVTPGSHFLMGGVVADSCGRTSISRLLAVGEVACTGVHGANRLASNSLLEGITFGQMMAENLLINGTRQKNFQQLVIDKKKNYFPLLPREQLQHQMLEKAGIIRDEEGLTNLLELLPTYEQICSLDLSQYTREQIEHIFMYITASLIVRAALLRTESRGAHIRKDFGEKDNQWQNKWIVFEKGHLYVRDGLYEQNQTTKHVETIFQ